MAGIKARNESFTTGVAKMHLLSESGGKPLYAYTDKKGVLDAITGTWKEGEIHTRSVMRANLNPVPPAVPKGGKVDPMLIEICNPASPDVERRRKAQGVDFDEPLADDATEEERVTRNLISIASCIVGWENLLMDNAEGKTEIYPYSESNAVQLLRDHPIAITQVGEFVGDAKKFERPSTIG